MLKRFSLEKVALLGALLVSLVAYQNCGSDFVVRDDLGSFSSMSTCEASLEAQFVSSYHTFLKTNCSNCHTGAGPGNGAFANSNPDVAFSAFLLATSDKIDTYAQNAAHASGYTGSQNASAIAVASQSWATAVSSCKSSPSGQGGETANDLVLKAKTMSANATAKDITWMLDSDIVGSSATYAGAKLIVAVRQIPSPNGTPVYYFSNPRLVGGTKPISLNGLMALINGQTQTLGSTFSRASATANAGQTVTLSTATMILEYDGAAASDTLAFSIDTLQLAN